MLHPSDKPQAKVEQPGLEADKFKGTLEQPVQERQDQKTQMQKMSVAPVVAGAFSLEGQEFETRQKL